MTDFPHDSRHLAAVYDRVSDFQLEGGKRLVARLALELVELHVTQTVSRHESGEAFVEFAEASSFGSLLAIVPEELRASLRAELVAAFESQRGPDGGIIRGWELLAIARRT